MRDGAIVKYSIKEIYYTLQGEGTHSGKPAVFCRFTGCNLWNGREQDRANAVCQFCDTNFIGNDGEHGGIYDSPEALAKTIDECWPCTSENSVAQKFVVCTGGEPLLQLDEALVIALQDIGFCVAVETNGTKLPPCGVDWVCVSPKANAPCILERGDELKLVFPQPDCDPSTYLAFEFDRFFLQPMDGPSIEENTRLATEYCLQNPKWELSLQTHKMIGLR